MRTASMKNTKQCLFFLLALSLLSGWILISNFFPVSHLEVHRIYKTQQIFLTETDTKDFIANHMNNLSRSVETSRNKNKTEHFSKKEIASADILIVGSGLSGAVLAHLHATLLKKKVLIIEKRDHIGGNCYDYINERGIRVSKYGAHLFHTKNSLVWRYLSQFSTWIPYEHRVVANVDGNYVPIPVNIVTVNMLFGESIKNQQEMKKWLKKHQIRNDRPKNGEEAAKARVGEVLFDKLFKGYTYKQWSKYPKDLDASVLQRIPVRDNFDDRYFPDDDYQALPGDGYTAMISQMLNHKLISVHLNTDFFHLTRTKKISVKHFSKTFFTGPIDSYFASSGLEKLEYRSIKFETIHLNQPFFQPNVVVNYPQGPENFTRIVEYKHLYNKDVNGTTIVREYSTDSGDPYYPVPNERNRNVYSKYAALAEKEEKQNNVYFVGRLASYKYFNMDQAVLNAINQFKRAYSDISFSEKQLFPKSLSEANEVFPQANGKLSVALVISHCSEDLSWFSKDIFKLCYNHKVITFIYEKCNQVRQGAVLAAQYPRCNIQQTSLPNVGREGHTWLYHMMVKQSMFVDLNIFVQGAKEVPTMNIFEAVDQMKQLLNFKKRDRIYSESKTLRNHYFSFGDYKCFDLKSDYLDWSAKRIEQQTCEYFYQITKSKQNCLEFHSNYRGEFVVTDVLLRRKLSLYRNLLISWYVELSKSNNPITGHIIERMWTLLFRYPHIDEC